MSERAAKLGHRRLPRPDDLRRSRREQPTGQRILPHARAGTAEQFEDGALAEQVEVFAIGVKGVAVALAGFAGAHPAVLQAVQAALVEIRRAPGQGAAAQHAVVHRGEGDEEGNRRQHPPAGECPARERGPGKHRHGGRYREARVAQAAMNLVVVSGC